MYMKKTVYGIIALAVLAIFLFGYMYSKKVSAPTVPVTSFEECVQAGFPVMESYPRQCRDGDGVLYVEKIQETITYTNTTSDMIVVELPYPGAVTGKTFSVIGKARGNWFFEASFPLEVLDKDGNILFAGIGQATSDWMTTEFVPFKADITIPATYIGPATLVLRKDNPSGEAQYDASISFPFTIEY